MKHASAEKQRVRRNWQAATKRKSSRNSSVRQAIGSPSFSVKKGHSRSCTSVLWQADSPVPFFFPFWGSTTIYLFIFCFVAAAAEAVSCHAAQISLEQDMWNWAVCIPLRVRTRDTGRDEKQHTEDVGWVFCLFLGWAERVSPLTALQLEPGDPQLVNRLFYTFHFTLGRYNRSRWHCLCTQLYEDRLAFSGGRQGDTSGTKTCWECKTNLWATGCVRKSATMQLVCTNDWLPPISTSTCQY